MATINSSVRVFAEGGRVLIGADVIANIQTGTLRWKPGLWEPKPFEDRDRLQRPPRRGKERPTELELDVKFTSAFTAAELYALLIAKGAGGTCKEFAVKVQVRDNVDATQGEQILFNYCYVSEPPEIQSGEQFDTMKIKFLDSEPYPTISQETGWPAA